MEFPISLPYYSLHTPCPLPTIEEIKAATPIGVDGAQKVIKFGDKLIIKYGSQVTTIEGENLLFVKQATRVSVPEVYAIFTDSEGVYSYIIMEYIPGEPLASAWASLDYGVKSIVACKLKEYLEDLRSIPSPEYYGSLGRRPLLESMFWTPEGDPLISGPFDTEAELNEAMARKYTHFGAPEFKANYYRRTFPQVFNGHRAVFTHADLQRKDIIIGSSNRTICVTLVDWEKSGWLPSYWEYSIAMLGHTFDDDWSEWLERIVEPCYVQYPYIKMLYEELWS